MSSERTERNGASIGTEGGAQEFREAPAHLYRSISFGELFLLWRNKELPQVVSEGGPDTDSQAGDVQTFWFDKPYQLNGRPGIAMLATGRMKTGAIKKGAMRYKRHPTSLQVDDAHLAGESTPAPKRYQVSEYYLSARVPLASLEVSMDEHYKNLLSENKRDLAGILEQIDYIDRVPRNIAHTFENILKGEFGSDAANLPDYAKIIPWELRTKSGMAPAEFGKEWVEIGQQFPWKLPSEAGSGILYLRRGALKQLAESYLSFIDWVESLPAAMFDHLR